MEQLLYSLGSSVVSILGSWIVVAVQNALQTNKVVSHITDAKHDNATKTAELKTEVTKDVVKAVNQAISNAPASPSTDLKV